MRYRVKLTGIVWDDGKGEYDVSEAPDGMTIEIEAPDASIALEWALDEASEDVGSLIEGVETTFVEPI